jgi:hypothetical protein
MNQAGFAFDTETYLTSWGTVESYPWGEELTDAFDQALWGLGSEAENSFDEWGASIWSYRMEQLGCYGSSALAIYRDSTVQLWNQEPFAELTRSVGPALAWEENEFAAITPALGACLATAGHEGLDASSTWGEVNTTIRNISMISVRVSLVSSLVNALADLDENLTHEQWTGASFAGGIAMSQLQSINHFIAQVFPDGSVERSDIEREELNALLDGVIADMSAETVAFPALVDCVVTYREQQIPISVAAQTRFVAENEAELTAFRNAISQFTWRTSQMGG